MPLQARKPRIIAIERDPLTAGLDGQCRKPCIRHKVATRVRCGAKALKNPPVSFTRLYDDAVGLSEKDVAKSEHLIQAAGHHKNLRVGGDADHTAQNLRRHTVTGVTINDPSSQARHVRCWGESIRKACTRMLTSVRITARS